MKKVYELKVNLKHLAVQIQATKLAFKKAQRAGEGSFSYWITLLGLRREYRHKHIAYCQLRGKARGQIEHPFDGNLPDETVISEIMAKYFDQPVEKSL